MNDVKPLVAKRLPAVCAKFRPVPLSKKREIFIGDKNKESTFGPSVVNARGFPAIDPKVVAKLLCGQIRLLIGSGVDISRCLRLLLGPVLS